MPSSEEPSSLQVTEAARDALGKAMARHPHPLVVRLRVYPGTPPTAQMYLAGPRSEDEVLEFGPARLVVDPESRSALRNAVIDFHPPAPGADQGSFSVDGPGLRPTPPSGGAETADAARFTGRTASGSDVEEREVRLREALRRIYDPEIPINIVDLGLIYGIEWPADGRVRIRMTMTSPGCPVTSMLQDEVRATAERVAGIREAEVRIVWSPPWNPERMSPEAKRRFGYA